MHTAGYSRGSRNERRFEEWRAEKIFLKRFLLFLLQGIVSVPPRPEVAAGGSSTRGHPVAPSV